VLVGATMPAVLVEVGFISNPAEEKKLKSPEFQQSLATRSAARSCKFFAKRKPRGGEAGRADDDRRRRSRAPRLSRSSCVTSALAPFA
jgi:hypothetical protein